MRMLAASGAPSRPANRNREGITQRREASMRTKLAKVNTWRTKKPPLRTGAGILILAAASAVGVAAIVPSSAARAATAQTAAGQAKAGHSSLGITKQFF